MNRFEIFELPVNKIQEYPLVFEAVIPDECSLFQDVRRYQSVTTNLDVRIINVDGRIQLEPGMLPVPMSKLSGSEKKEFIEYLKLRITRGDNIGSSWVFFRSIEKKKPLVAFGANIVYRNAATGQSRAIHLLTELQKSGPGLSILLKLLVILLIAGLIGSMGYYGYKHFISGKSLNMGKLLPGRESEEMKFYHTMFPEVYEWLSSDVVDRQLIAKELLKPEYVSDTLACINKDFYKDSNSSENYRGTRLVLFVYFNYNEQVKAAISSYRSKLEDTEFGRLSRIYSCEESGFSSNIFYFKVGDLNVDPPAVNQFLTDNMVSYNDYQRIRDNQNFSDMLKNENINVRLKNFLSDVYTFTPLKVDEPVEDIDWYMLVRRNSSGKVNFAAFFRRGESTLIPTDVSRRLMAMEKSDNETFQWYLIDEYNKKTLNLTRDAIGYFTEKIGQTFKLEVIDRKIDELELEPFKGDFPVAVHRELLMEDSKGKYGIQCYDPLTALVLSNVITRTSFEKNNSVTLKRDPIQLNTSLVQLSRDDSTSTQAINISPGKSSIVNIFREADRFRATLASGESVRFEKADINLFTPFAFMVYSDSITFSYRHDIKGMEFAIGKRVLKIVESGDGGYQIVEIH
ncbi:conserved hypothetical protein [Desulfamplus magnetovallimortis]|uniref:Uncharacterized protein n=1 Tax=Desulfamplus magnetovallimortis TaxID=1246637 RepID=A0A1W1H7C5_9BACT|nr:hypothetical protein [Desulfamplus magnetovallimortis]SLM28278.1 conserved hypothetical protein [Desulfamplus magnetovallimortis]